MRAHGIRTVLRLERKGSSRHTAERSVPAAEVPVALTGVRVALSAGAPQLRVVLGRGRNSPGRAAQLRPAVVPAELGAEYVTFGAWLQAVSFMWRCGAGAVPVFSVLRKRIAW